MKKLYARLVLWLIRPALELRGQQDGEAMIKQIKAMGLAKPFRASLAAESR